MPSSLREDQMTHKFWRMMRRLSATAALLVVVGHVYASVSWDHYFASHCEGTPMSDSSSRDYALAWSCDNGKTYFP